MPAYHKATVLPTCEKSRISFPQHIPHECFPGGSLTHITLELSGRVILGYQTNQLTCLAYKNVMVESGDVH